VGADRPEREVALTLLPRALRGSETVVCDKGYAGREFQAQVAELGASVVRPARRDEPDQGVHLAPIRQRIESVFHTCWLPALASTTSSATQAGRSSSVASAI
jgi:hypothetical protein